MKKILSIATVILVAGLVVLWMKGKNVQEIQTEIEIKAPPSKVWGLLTDFNTWADWSPIVNKASGDFALGSKLAMTMAGKDGKDGPQYAPVIINIEEPRSFRWRAKMMAHFIFTNDKVFELEETSTGTRLVHKELFSGLLAPLFCSKMEEGVPPMLNSMNEALKAKLEGGPN